MFTLLQFFIVSIIILVFGLWIATKFPFEGLTAAITIIIFLLSIGAMLVESMGQKKIYELKRMETKNLELMVNGKYLEEIQDHHWQLGFNFTRLRIHHQASSATLARQRIQELGCRYLRYRVLIQASRQDEGSCQDFCIITP